MSIKRLLTLAAAMWVEPRHVHYEQLYGLGPRADKRKRKKRLAKKLRKRGNMRRCRGLVQSYYKAWPARA